MKITTQLHINRLIELLPNCILDLIKSFLFYDIETYKIMQIAKLNKKKVFYIINNVDLSRANNFDNDILLERSHISVFSNNIGSFKI